MFVLDFLPDFMGLFFMLMFSKSFRQLLFKSGGHHLIYMTEKIQP